MNDPHASAGRGSLGRALLATAAVVACAGAGFVLFRLTHPPSALHVALPSASPAAPPAASGPGPTEPEPPAPPERRIPEVLPPVTLPGLDGRSHALSQWKGHPLLVNFWASWCEPCRREIPLLKALRRERAQDGLEVVGIAIDFRDAVQKYAHDSQIDYPVLVGEDGGYEAVAAFGMEPILPFTAFADGEGRIVSLKVGELHRDEAQLILNRLEDLQQGRLSLPAARAQIAEGVARLGAARAAAAAAR